MAFSRTTVPDFALPNPYYIGASVTFWNVDAVTGAKTTLATIYDAISGTGTLKNPLTLDSEGKFEAPAYIDVPVIAEIKTNDTARDHETGIILTNLAEDAVLEAQQASDLALAQAGVLTGTVKKAKAAADAAAVSAGKMPDPIVSGSFIRGKADLTGNEYRTPAQVRGDLSLSDLAVDGDERAWLLGQIFG